MKLKTIYRCNQCADIFVKWMGRCSGCGQWNTLVEDLDVAVPAPLEARLTTTRSEPPVSIVDIDVESWSIRPTGLDELDRVLGGGLVPGSVTLIGGEPGTGKSTLLLQALASMARGGWRCLMVTAEESAQQVRMRAERLGALVPGLDLVAETTMPTLVAHLSDASPPYDVIVVDSIQTIHDPVLAAPPGSVTQVRECAHRLVQLARDRGASVILVGHVTKEGTLAGPRVLEHVVDTVLSFEGDRHHALRLLRAVKHRFGATQELGLFQMIPSGLVGVADPSGLFLADRKPGLAGSVVVATVEGHRPLVVEVQGLVSSTDIFPPRRSAQGIDPGRLSLLLAVLDQRVGCSMGKSDVHVSAVGGVKLFDPGSDLAVALALVSAFTGQPMAPDLVACGEVGLGGELRQASQTDRRLAEAYRLGFRTAALPARGPDPPAGMTALRAATLLDAVHLVGMDIRRSRGKGREVSAVQ